MEFSIAQFLNIAKKLLMSITCLLFFKSEFKIFRTNNVVILLKIEENLEFSLIFNCKDIN